MLGSGILFIWQDFGGGYCKRRCWSSAKPGLGGHLLSIHAGHVEEDCKGRIGKVVGSARAVREVRRM